MDDLYNNLEIYKTKVKGSSSSSQNSQNVTFVSPNISGGTNQAHGFNSAYIDSLSDSVIYSFFANQSNSPQLDNEDLQQIVDDDLEEINLKWLMAMLTMRAKRFLKKTEKKVGANGYETIRAPRENKNREPVRRNVTVEATDAKALVAQDGFGYDWSDQAEDGPTNFAFMAYTSSGAYKIGLESVKARLVVYKKNEEIFEEDIKFLKHDIHLRDNALTELRKKLEKAKKERDEIKITLEKFENSSKTLNKMLDSQVNDKNKTSVGYHAVPPPYTGSFMLPKPDLILADVDEYVVNESVTSVHAITTNKAKTSKSKPKSVCEPLIEDWISDSEDENETETKSKQRKLSFAKVNSVKASACWVWRPKHKVLDHVSKNNGASITLKKFNYVDVQGVIGSGSSRHMTGNMSYLFEYEEIDGGYVAFGGEPKRGKITDTECVVLSPDFKLLDERQVLFRVHRKNNMYSVDLKNVAPLGGLTCLFAKAALDESNLWHRRLGHINFKTINKLVKGNLVRVIMTGDEPAAIASVSGGAEATIPPKTTVEKIARRNELKAKTIKTRFRGNKESKKMQKTILKQKYENFVASRSEGLDKTYDMFQKLISQLEIHGEVISQEDANLKLLRSLPPAWNTHTLIMRNKSDLDTLSMDDLYNNLKVYEAEI
nr:hypothetical protein [Tanacetum cinerariifolium]